MLFHLRNSDKNYFAIWPEAVVWKCNKSWYKRQVLRLCAEVRTAGRAPVLHSLVWTAINVGSHVKNLTNTTRAQESQKDKSHWRKSARDVLDNVCSCVLNLILRPPALLMLLVAAGSQLGVGCRKFTDSQFKYLSMWAHLSFLTGKSLQDIEHLHWECWDDSTLKTFLFW